MPPGKGKKLKHFIVFADHTGPGYFEVGDVLAEDEDDACAVVREQAGTNHPVGDNSHGLWLPLVPQTTLTVRRVENARGPVIGYSDDAPAATV